MKKLALLIVLLTSSSALAQNTYVAPGIYLRPDGLCVNLIGILVACPSQCFTLLGIPLICPYADAGSGSSVDSGTPRDSDAGAVASDAGATPADSGTPTAVTQIDAGTCIRTSLSCDWKLMSYGDGLRYVRRDTGGKACADDAGVISYTPFRPRDGGLVLFDYVAGSCRPPYMFCSASTCDDDDTDDQVDAPDLTAHVCACYQPDAGACVILTDAGWKTAPTGQTIYSVFDGGGCVLKACVELPRYPLELGDSMLPGCL